MHGHMNVKLYATSKDKNANNRFIVYSTTMFLFIGLICSLVPKIWFTIKFNIV